MQHGGGEGNGWHAQARPRRREGENNRRHCEKAKPTRQSSLYAGGLDCRGALRLATTKVGFVEGTQGTIRTKEQAPRRFSL